MCVNFEHFLKSFEVDDAEEEEKLKKAAAFFFRKDERPDSDICTCACHHSGNAIKHCVACCQVCPVCGQRIVIGRLHQHKERCNARP